MKKTIKSATEAVRKGVKSIVSPNNFIMVSVDGESYQITKDNKDFAKVEALVKRKEWDKVFNLLGAKKNISVFSEGNIKIEGDKILYKGKQVDNYIVTKIISMLNEGSSDWQPLARFLDKVMQSEYDHVKEHLYKFLEYGNIPLTPDGNFLGYKSVNSDYTDCHTHTFDNTPGNIVRMKRSDVVSNPNQACSSGLHVGVNQYVSGFGGSKKLIVNVDPRNVISVPFDYGHQKMRTCEYYVVAEYDPAKPLTSEVYNVKIPENAPVSTGEGKITEVAKPIAVTKYVAENSGPLRDKFGRFIKKPAVTVSAKTGPTRDAKGRFLKKGEVATKAPTKAIETQSETSRKRYYQEQDDTFDDEEGDDDDRW